MERRNVSTVVLTITVLMMIHLSCTPVSNSASVTPANPEIVAAIKANSWQITLPVTDYFLKMSQDKVECYLPYTGRSLTGMDVMNYKNPLDFTSSQYELSISDRAPGGYYNLVIKPKDVPSVQSLQVTLFEGGDATVRVNLNDRDPFGANGTIRPVVQQ